MRCDMMTAVKRWPCAIVVSIAIIILSTIPVPDVPELEDVPFFDKWVHFVMYGGLSSAIWFDRAIISNRRMHGKIWTFLFVYPVALGGLMELVQAYCTTCRSGDWVDFYADTFGALIGLALCMAINKPLGKKR